MVPHRHPLSALRRVTRSIEPAVHRDARHLGALHLGALHLGGPGAGGS